MIKNILLLVACGCLSLQTLSAQTVDVTGLVKGQVKNNVLSVPVNNEAMDGDPAEGAKKKLKVEYTVDNLPGSNVVFEGGTFTLKVPEGKTLKVIRAVYGDLPDKVVDVTEKLTSAVSANKLSIEITNNTMGGDPCSGPVKELRVTYKVGKSSHQAVLREYDLLNLPLDTDGTGDLVIVRADYGVFE